MIEIRIHGRGGQGSVTMAELLAEAIFYDGKFSQAFPNFGVERRGAPVEAYVRIDDKFIRLRSQIYEPDYIIIQDESLINIVEIFKGAKKGTIVLINTKRSAVEFKAPPGVAIKTIAATDIATETIGKPIFNTVLVGAFAGLSGLVSFKAVEKAISKKFEGEVGKKNIEAAKRGYEVVSNNLVL
ncbi:MAG: pyruvate ferredoxin oxidoreductase subunit gamma [Patescibacteria group bacterium]